MSENYNIHAGVFGRVIGSYHRDLCEQKKESLRNVISFVSQELKLPLQRDDFLEAVATDCIDLVRLLHCLGCPWDEEIFRTAVLCCSDIEVNIFHDFFIYHSNHFYLLEL